MNFIPLIISIAILIMSVVVHEVAHGFMAWRLGDPTAKDANRLTLNPIKHLDLFGSVILPLLLVISHANFFFAWAKPVPYNPYFLKDKKWGELKVALAGPLSNLSLAIFFGLIARLLNTAWPELVANNNFIQAIFLIGIMACTINLALMIFNLIPIPPLDGSKIIYAFISDRARIWFYKMEQYSFILLFILIFSRAFDFIIPVISYLFFGITGFTI